VPTRRTIGLTADQPLGPYSQSHETKSFQQSSETVSQIVARTRTDSTVGS